MVESSELQKKWDSLLNSGEDATYKANLIQWMPCIYMEERKVVIDTRRQPHRSINTSHKLQAGTIHIDHDVCQPYHPQFPLMFSSLLIINVRGRSVLWNLWEARTEYHKTSKADIKSIQSNKHHFSNVDSSDKTKAGFTF